MKAQSFEFHRDNRGTPDLTYMGRHGIGKCKGLNVESSDEAVELRPINSKGDVSSNCVIQIPPSALRKVGEMLIQMSKPDVGTDKQAGE